MGAHLIEADVCEVLHYGNPNVTHKSVLSSAQMGMLREIGRGVRAPLGPTVTWESLVRRGLAEGTRLSAALTEPGTRFLAELDR